MTMVMTNHRQSSHPFAWIFLAVATACLILPTLAIAGNEVVDVHVDANVDADVVAHDAQCDAPKTSRDRISFNYGWHFRTGLTAWAPADELAPTNVDPGLTPPESKIDFDAAKDNWKAVQLPHDGIIANAPSHDACPNGCSGRSFLPRHVLWYRKTFDLPCGWTNDNHIWLEFEGSFRNTTVWINEQPVVIGHESGYTPFVIDLDPFLENIKDTGSVRNSAAATPQFTLAVFVDPDNGDDGGASRGSGWWYEGGGLYRHVWLHRAPKQHRIDDLFVYTNDIQLETSEKALWATLHGNMTLLLEDIDDDSKKLKLEDYCVDISIANNDGSPLNNAEVSLLHSGPSDHFDGGFTNTSSYSYQYQVKLIFPHLWTTARPYLYHVQVFLRDCFTGKELDSVSTYHGIRTIDYTAAQGFSLNSQAFKIRGFCDHNTFGVVGMAVPDRINLFRAQASRSIGGNARRTSHNPPDPTLLDLYDRLGMVVLDENRLFGNKTKYVENMKALVKRDRNHPSVILWSFCNELGCQGQHEVAGPAFQEVVDTYDGTRPTLANMMKYGGILSDTVDVQGFSHRPRATLDECHANMPDKPIMMSECCSCNTMRGEDAGCETTYDNPHYACDQGAFNARCLEQTVNASDGVEYAAGTFVWTLFDYYGEPPSAGLTVSSTYGQFDLMGFAKPAAFWFRSQWLLNVSDGRPDKTFETMGKYEVQLVESWESPDSWDRTKGNTTRTIHAYSNAPFIELFVNNASQGILPVATMVRGAGSYAEFEDVEWKAGTLSAVARMEEDGDAVSTTEVNTCGPPAALKLSLDCPSPHTGTGSALFLDGQDAALIRASIVDATGQVVHMANSQNVSFAIVSGPGEIQGTGSGNPKSYEANNAPWHIAYHGLVRAVVRVTSGAGLSDYEKAMLQAMDSKGSLTSSLDLGTEDDIVLEASAPGLNTVRLTIPTSTDPKHSVLQVAQAGAGKAVDFFDEVSEEESPAKFMGNEDEEVGFEIA